MSVDQHTASLVGLHGGWRHARMKLSLRLRIQCSYTREKRPPKTICKDIKIKMTPYKPKKITPVQDTSDEEEEMNYRILTLSRNGK
ncbi:hypothetical protein TNCV_1014371 [Trichonephila clavipes]|uniref:Uncharacterized protein n=1 Tax=Trichonephila clavipes TaxID=2585209 RepID=A0A8X6VXR1_TRICX|nr:hypothetical protein TNCV_1014371 [Trichonephila clavipes]